MTELVLKEVPSLSDAIDKLRRVHQSVRQLNKPFPNPSKVFFIKLYEEWMYDEPVRRLVIFSPVIHGCEYRLKTGGCSMCGEFLGIGRTPSLFQAITPIVDLISKLSSVPRWICWYIEGSNLNSKEFPKIGLETVLRLFAEQGAKRITIEARPEYVSDAILDTLEDIGKTYDTEIEIGIGLETRNCFIRNSCIFKGFSWEDFKEAVKRINERRSLRALAYVLLKPPFLTEGEAIADAENTISEAFKVGVNAVSLELMTVAEFTLVEFLWLKGCYRSPWLWSAVKILEDMHDKGEIRIGGEPETYYPRSARAAFNDAKCTMKVWKSLQEYNRTHGISCLTRLSCDCKQMWFKEVLDGIKLPREGDLTQRIINKANNLCIDEYMKLKLNSYRR